MNSKVSCLSNAELDYWVARAEGIQHVKIQEVPRTNEKICVIGAENGVMRYDPSTNWSVFGPLLKKHNVFYESSNIPEKGPVFALIEDSERGYVCGEFGDDLLIAACRCIVTSKFGDKVPKE